MDKELLQGLYAIKEARDLRDKTISEDQTYDVERFMSDDVVSRYRNFSAPVKPIEPTEPQEPIKPEEPVKPKPDPLPKKLYLDWTMPGWVRTLLIIGAVIVAGAFFTMLGGNYEYQRGLDLQAQGVADWNMTPASEVIRNGFTTLIVSWVLYGVGGGLVLLPYFIHMMKEVSDAKKVREHDRETVRNRNKWAKERYDEKLANLPKQMDEYNNALLKYKTEMAQYEVDMNTHREAMKAYRERCMDYERVVAEYNREKSNASPLMDRYNEAIVSKANDKFDDFLLSSKVEFPKNYVGSIEKIIQIIEDMRADTVQEAIQVMIKSSH